MAFKPMSQVQMQMEQLPLEDCKSTDAIYETP
jgi:hypothetical protein